MGEQHLDLLSLAPGGDVGVGLGDVAGEVPGPFMDRAGDLARRRVGAAAALKGAGVTVGLAGPISVGVVRWNVGMIDAEGPSIALELLAFRAVIEVGLVIEGEVRPLECPVLPL